MAERKQQRPEELERGDIFFLYRPRVEEDDPSGLGDVQRFYVVLQPDERKKVRLLTVGRKRLPDVRQHERNWGFVSSVSSSPEKIEEELREDTYETKTRGEQRLPAVRPAGEGRYAVDLIDGQMRLAYALELPEEPSEVQRAFRIAPEASFALSVKNPEKPGPKGAGLGEHQQADFPDRLQDEFRGRRFAGEDVRLLDVEGAEFVMVGARVDPRDSFDLDPEDHETHPEILRELRMAKSRHPQRPLFEGKWD